jgi:hypothetical protein
MILDGFEEKILRRIHDLGPERIYNKLFRDKKSKSAVSTLIRLNLVETKFDISDEQVERYRRGQSSDQEEYDLHLALTEDGLAYFEEMYKPSTLFNLSSFRIKAVAWVCLGSMLLGVVGALLWVVLR